MTRPDAPPSSTSNDAEYVRKLALAILSALQNKGLLTADEVDAVLIAARRAAAQAGQNPSGQPKAQVAPPRDQTPRPPLQFQVTAKPPAPQPSVSWSVTRPPEVAPGEAQTPSSAAPAKEALSREGGEPRPPVIDIQLD